MTPLDSGSPDPALGVRTGPMLYSAPAIQLVEELRYRIGRKLKREALERAQKAGRNLVSDDDIWAVAEEILGASLDEETQDE